MDKVQSVKVRMLSKAAGQCIAMMRAVIPAKLLLHNVCRTIARKCSWEDALTLDNDCVNDLLWWQEAIINWNGAPLHLRDANRDRCQWYRLGRSMSLSPYRSIGSMEQKNIIPEFKLPWAVGCTPHSPTF